MLRAAGLSFVTDPARIDEEAVIGALLAEGAHARDVVDTLAELKAAKIAARHPEAVVVGSDQVLAFGGALIGKPATQDAARAQLSAMSGQSHGLLSAAVVYHEGQPVWRHVEVVKMTMRAVSDAYIEAYVARNWAEIQHSAGGYQIEAEGIRLFDRIEGSYHAILGLPLLPLLGYLAARGWIET